MSKSDINKKGSKAEKDVSSAYIAAKELGAREFADLPARKSDGAPLLQLEYVPLKRHKVGDERRISTIVTPEMAGVLAIMVSDSASGVGNETLRLRFTENSLPLNSSVFYSNQKKISTSGEQLEHLLRAHKKKNPRLLDYMQQVEKFYAEHEFVDEDIESPSGDVGATEGVVKPPVRRKSNGGRRST